MAANAAAYFVPSSMTDCRSRVSGRPATSWARDDILPPLFRPSSPGEPRRAQTHSQLNPYRAICLGSTPEKYGLARGARPTASRGVAGQGGQEASPSAFAGAGLDFTRLEAVFLTHLHADHIGDLPGMLLYPWSARAGDNGPLAPIRVYGPSRPSALPAGDAVFHRQTTICPELPAPGTADLIAHILAGYAYHLNVMPGSPRREGLQRQNHGRPRWPPQNTPRRRNTGITHRPRPDPAGIPGHGHQAGPQGPRPP
jgi:Metallo-beta-lactamase superfamily